VDLSGDHQPIVRLNDGETFNGVGGCEFIVLMHEQVERIVDDDCLDLVRPWQLFFESEAARPPPADRLSSRSRLNGNCSSQSVSPALGSGKTGRGSALFSSRRDWIRECYGQQFN
jgi:hypothetical protein